jgi:hypothetical protein
LQTRARKLERREEGRLSYPAAYQVCCGQEGLKGRSKPHPEQPQRGAKNRAYFVWPFNASKLEISNHIYYSVVDLHRE